MKETADLKALETSVEFESSDRFLGDLYKAAEAVLKGNVKDFGGRPVLIEGGGYNSIWIETQPMGGEMYAKRNMEAAINNVSLFTEYQHENGRYPYRISIVDGKPEPAFFQFQGFCFPHHALNLYYWGKKRSAGYLERLYRSLEAFDAYLWKYRDSDGDGCLEIWCPLDTGEDHSNRFAGALEARWNWPGETPPLNDPVFPIESMDVMGYSHDARLNLAKLSRLLDNGEEARWNEKAAGLRRKIRSYLWDESRDACYDRDRDNRFMPALQHNNLRVMYHQAFSEDMARRFLTRHLLNPEEFFTPMPLPSIAVNNPVFRNISENNWSGQCEGLSYQRAIRALENYGFYSEMAVFGAKLIDCVGKRNTFPQQFDPFTGEFSEAGKRTTYGPTALSVLEYISRFYGVHLQFDEIWWGALGRKDHELSYTQKWDGNSYTVETGKRGVSGLLNGRELFSAPAGLRVVSDWEGRVKSAANMSAARVEGEFSAGAERQRISLEPNELIAFA
ncbi:MAG: hypothetical protein LBH26_01515 [Treponema sp.]|jgi:hypothetical protein|nr:hypothetical protein [Treponema sp.]